MSIKIYFDMDGVLADFEQSAIKYRPRSADLNRPNEYLSDAQKAAKLEFYRKIEGTNFYGDLAVMPGAGEMIAAAKAVAGDNVFILTKIPKAANFITGALLTDANEQRRIAQQKIEWVLRHFGDYFSPDRIITVMDGTKGVLLRPTKTDILVDDRPDNIANWTGSGGTGILYTSAADTATELAGLKK
ncbi:MAG: hypothetical protein FWG39_01445 [Alphaproteobacteria bacterium]|nr:hypothetical protein [Alphaproteobacteria bacterium]